MESLQIYWWFIISLLGGILVFLLFVQGGQTMLYGAKTETRRQLMVNSLGRKWELTFTTLVVFGGAFFASFPLFYSTSFGGAYWLWMLILGSFVVQAFSYEFRRKSGNIFGRCTYDTLLMLNGFVGCTLLGVAVATMFFGAEFTVSRDNLLDTGSPVISQWAHTHGLEAIFAWKNLVLGFAVLFLARTMGALYFINNISDGETFAKSMRTKVTVNGVVFVILFLAFLTLVLTSDGMTDNADGTFTVTPYKYVDNMLALWPLTCVMMLGVLMVLSGILLTVLKTGYRHGIWWTGTGVVLTVTMLLCLAGYNHTAYYPSLLDANSSLSIANSSSTHFTLTVMTWVSAFVPVVVLYIGYVWYKMNAKPLTTHELEQEHHTY